MTGAMWLAILVVFVIIFILGSLFLRLMFGVGIRLENQSKIIKLLGEISEKLNQSD